jgi:hypothetical protein
MGNYYILDDSVVHSGIKGMKHGQRRYQYPDGTWTEEGKARRRKSEHKSFFEARREKRAAKRAAKREAEKQRIIREGTAAEAYQIRNELTNQEKQQILDRINWDTRLSDAAVSNIKAGGKTKAEKIIKGLEMTASAAKSIGTIVDSANKVKKFMDGQDSSSGKKE